jgi:hypothetical protein
VTYSGTLLGESLRTGAVLDDLPFSVTKIYRAVAGDVGAGQPELWTFMEFIVPDERAIQLAEMLRRSLGRTGGWYCDFRSDREVFVVFADRVFRYERGNEEERAKAEAYGRLMGVPEAQLDWPG